MTEVSFYDFAIGMVIGCGIGGLFCWFVLGPIFDWLEHR